MCRFNLYFGLYVLSSVVTFTVLLTFKFSFSYILNNSKYNAFNVYLRELAPGTVSLTGDRAQGDDSKHLAYSSFQFIYFDKLSAVQCLNSPDQLKSVTDIMSLTVLSRVFLVLSRLCHKLSRATVTGFVDIVTGMQQKFLSFIPPLPTLA